MSHSPSFSSIRLSWTRYLHALAAMLETTRPHGKTITGSPPWIFCAGTRICPNSIRTFFLPRRIEIEVPRARLNGPGGKTTEWNSQVLRAYQRRTLAADALIASTYLAGTNTRRVRRALKALFGGAVGKDTVSRVWRKVKADWDAWNARSLAAEPIVRLIL